MKNFSAPDAPPAQDGRRDHLGTSRAVVDRSRNKVIWRWNIMGEVFGADAPQEDPDKDGQAYVLDMRFPGQRYDRYTGLFQNRFRDYDPTSGRYVQSDPIGMRGGMSTYSYAGANPQVAIDPLGLFHVNGVYFKNSGTLVLEDHETGLTVTQRFESGGKPFGDAIPSGWYDILERKGKPDFYRLEPIDSTYGDDMHDGTGRNNFRLHRPGMTIGCVAAQSWDDWRPVDDLLRKTVTDNVIVPTHSMRPWSEKTEVITRFGRIRVED